MTDLHPIVARMQPSAEQQPAVAARGCNVAVTAGAGTGKTRTLVARYLSLVALDGAGRRDLRSVVAITFTRKAAREMRNRVRQEVQRYLRDGDLSEVELKHWRDLYTALDAARIGTFHSLCGEILRHHPAEVGGMLGVDPGFEMLSEGQMGLLKSQVVEEALGRIAGDASLASLFTLLGEREVRGLVATLLDKRLDLADIWLTLPGSLGDPDPAGCLIACWQGLIEEQCDRAVDRLLCASQFGAALEDLRACVPLDAGDKIAQQQEQVLSFLFGLPVTSLSQVSRDVEVLSVLGQINLQGGRQASWQGGKDTLEQVKAALKTLRDAWKTHAGDITLALTQHDIDLAHHMPLIRSIFDWACTRYAALKAERRSLDFDDLEAGAVALLEAHPDVVATWRREVAALLVDEFQDTNRRQSRLLDLLNDGGGKLFTVGDAKQSIYRFRGADVTVFREQMARVDSGNGSPLTVDLSTSYRAHRGLLEMLNALLAPVLGRVEDPERPFVEPFAPLLPSRDAPLSGLNPPFVELHLAAGSKQEGAMDRAAQALANRLVALVETGGVTVCERREEDGVEVDRPLGYGDIAILCRASSSFAAYEDALEAVGVPFLTVAGRGFYERPEVRDTLNALQALADPSDDISLAGLLRSPAMGLSDMALVRLVMARKGVEATSPRAAASLWDVLAGDVAFLEDEAIAARRARSLVTELAALSGRVLVADVLKAFLDRTDYRAALFRARQTRAVYNLDKLLADAHASEMMDVGAFLEYVRQLRDIGTREGEAHVLAEGAVQLMTVHAAKGLEFPVVVLGDISRASPRTRGPLVDRDTGLVLPLKGRVDADNEGDDGSVLSAIYRLVHSREQEREGAEGDRLFYVAATRARDLLLVSGTLGRGLTGWLARLGAALEVTSTADLVGDMDLEGTQVRADTLNFAGHPLGLWVYPKAADLAVTGLPAMRHSSKPQGRERWVAVPPDELPMLRAFKPEYVAVDEAAEAETQVPPRRVWRVVPDTGRAHAPSWVVGKLVHGALERWLFPGETNHAFWRWAYAEASGCGITDEREARDAVLRAETVLIRFQATSLCDRMDRANRMFHELPYSLERDDGRMENGVIDALFESAGSWTLVEFKTDSLRDAEHLEQMLKDKKNDYVRQVSSYLDAVERLLGQRPQPVLCFLNCGGAVRVVMDRW